MTALYLHIPFCLSKCRYCSFQSISAGEKLYAPYVAALALELTRLAGLNSVVESSSKLRTLFVGGGTPTCLPVELLQGVIRSSLDLFGVESGAEISVEANPGTVNAAYLEALLEVGVNRLSLGVQSFDNRELERIGRLHDAQEACSAIKAALSAGFRNINLDLMYGLPGQTPASWRHSLEKGLSFHPGHLSLYQLTIEADTPFFYLVENNTLRLPEEEAILEMDEITTQLCGSAELHQYETSNYACDGHQCRHNINYWRNNDYLAAGTAAVSCLHGVRERRIADPAEYIRRIHAQQSVVIETEQLSREGSFRETVIMGLRMVQGVSLGNLYERYALDILEYYGSTVEKLIAFGFIELTATHLRITAKGRPLANQIMAQLV
jgi:oxygen-independent coproporphyrinogen III oxidase